MLLFISNFAPKIFEFRVGDKRWGRNVFKKYSGEWGCYSMGFRDFFGQNGPFLAPPLDNNLCKYSS